MKDTVTMSMEMLERIQRAVSEDCHHCAFNAVGCGELWRTKSCLKIWLEAIEKDNKEKGIEP